MDLGTAFLDDVVAVDAVEPLPLQEGVAKEQLSVDQAAHINAAEEGDHYRIR
ncbi:hypothetical protein [Nitrosospira sp. Nsp2]|uniref:hypothetical protein n=1 Tax=Nitrosospira sp. Nsp2 TaxID=136548 RepID=UPI0015E6AF8C|nr:hypothetical protein [Nitrosospira sp. Nsp2]